MLKDKYIILSFILLVFFISQPLFSQDQQVSINANAPSETSQFLFLLGKWDARYSSVGIDGKKQELKAIWEIKMILDNSAYQDNWEVFDDNGQSLGHGTMFRTYNRGNSQWEIVEITSWKPVYHHMTAKAAGERMIMYEEQERKGQVIKGRRVFSNITKDSFLWDYQEWNPEKEEWVPVSQMKVKRIN